MKEKYNMNLKPFDLEAAKNGAEVVTREGLPVEIIKFDVKSLYSIIAIITDLDGSERTEIYDNKGCYYFEESSFDLFLKEPEPKIETWYGVVFNTSEYQTYKGGSLYKTKEEAVQKGKNLGERYIGIYSTEIELEV